MLSDPDLDSQIARTASLWPAIHGKRVFISGGTGFFGRWMLWLLARALGRDIRVVVLTRDPQRAHERLGELTADNSVTLTYGSVTDFEFPAGSFDYVLHLAGEPHGPRYVSNPRETAGELVAGTARMFDFAKAAGATRFLFISTGAVYGPQRDIELIDEEAPWAEDSVPSRRAYAKAKRAGEEAALASRVPTVIARPFAFVGPGLPENVGFAAADFLNDGLAGRPVRVRHGDVVRSYLYATDLAEWLWTLLLRGRPGRAYNVGSEEPVTLADVGRAIAAECGVPVEIGTESVIDRYVPLTRRAREELDLRETVNWKDAVRKTVTLLRDVADAPHS